MCLNPSDHIDAHALSVALLELGETRGRDATGAGWYAEDGRLFTQKDHFNASRWVKYCEVPSSAMNVILHTRAATQGSKYQNENNHPVQSGDVIGVHNGIVWNDDRIFDMIGKERRIGQVDSEAIFAAIAYGMDLDDEGDPLLAKTLGDVLEKINGSAAVGWHEIGADARVLHVARISQSPFWWGQTKNGSFIFASTREMLVGATDKVGVKLDHTEMMAEGTYLRVRNGTICDRILFDSGWRATTNNGAGYGQYGSARRIGSAGSVASAPAAKHTPVATVVPASEHGAWKTPEAGKEDEPIILTEGGIVKRYEFKDRAWRLASSRPIGSTDAKEFVSTGSATITELAAAFDKVDAEANSEDEKDKAIDNILSDLKDRTTDFSPVFGRQSMHSHIMHDLNNGAPLVDGDEFQQTYPSRIDEIERWEKTYQSENDDDAIEVLDALGGFLRQGDWVYTDLGATTKLRGQIMYLPAEFPDGEYVIRVLVPNVRYKSGFEPVMIARRHDEFQTDNDANLLAGYDD